MNCLCAIGSNAPQKCTTAAAQRAGRDLLIELGTGNPQGASLVKTGLLCLLNCESNPLAQVSSAAVAVAA
jgi:hypothetical protein